MRSLVTGLFVLLLLAALPASAANLSVTASNVSPGTNAVFDNGVALEAVTAGQVLYKRASDGQFGLCDNNSATAEVRVPHGIAVNNAAANQGVRVQTGGRINIGATVVAGTPYFTSDTAGSISNLQTDAASGEYPAFLGFAIATTTIDLNIVYSGVVVP
jgi:hypothetical protein